VTARGRYGPRVNVVLHIQQPPGTDVLTNAFGTIDP
jgi:hypothetical protein